MRPSRKHPVPADLVLLYEFVNSLDERTFVRDGVPQVGGDELATIQELEDWMRSRGLLARGVHLDRGSHRAALELRDALHAFLRLAPLERGDSEAALRVNRAAAKFPLLVGISESGDVGLEPASGVRASGLGAVLAQLQLASVTGRLDRLKACAADDCHRVFYDRSKPGTRRWCSSALCGNREKTRAYRLRQRGGAAAE